MLLHSGISSIIIHKIQIVKPYFFVLKHAVQLGELAVCAVLGAVQGKGRNGDIAVERGIGIDTVVVVIHINAAALDPRM